MVKRGKEMNKVDIMERGNRKQEKRKILIIYLISGIIFSIYISRFIGINYFNTVLPADIVDIKIRMNIVLSSICVVSCMMFYKSNQKEEIFIMSLLYILLSLDILNSRTTGFLCETTYEYNALITSLIRVCIAYIAICRKNSIKEWIINNRKKSIIIVIIIGHIAIKIEYYLMMPYSHIMMNLYQIYNIILTIVYIVIGIKYFKKSINEDEYIYSVIGASTLLFSIRSIYDFYYLIESSIEISVRGDSAMRLGCILYIVGLFIEVGKTTKKNKTLDEQRNLFIKIIDENKHSNVIICDENYVINYINNKAKNSLDEIEYIENFNRDIGCKLDIKGLFQGVLDTDIIDYHILLDGNYRKEVYIKDSDSILDFSIHLIEVNYKRYKVITIKDISEKYKLEKTLLEYEMMKHDEQLKNEFLSNITHELKTPLNIIYSTNQLLDISLDKDNFKDIYMRYSSSFNMNCKRMLRLIDNIVDITKSDVGYKEPKYANYNIVNLIEEMTLSVINYAKIKSIEIVFDTDIEELYIKCDLDMIERIILNLLSNAIKFSDRESNIQVRVFHDEYCVGISVIDEGIGIDPEIQDKIFDRFVQGDKSIRRKNEGSGIGLSLVKSFVELLEGEIILRSDGKSGSEFTVYLPNELLDSQTLKSQYNLDVERVKLEFSDIYELYEHTYTI